MKVLNGLAIDPSKESLYATDSTAGTVWKVSLRTGTASLWAEGPALKASNGSGISANGIKPHAGGLGEQHR